MQISLFLRVIVAIALAVPTAWSSASTDRWAEGERRPVGVSATETRIDLDIDRRGMYTIFSEGDIDVVCRLFDPSGAEIAMDDDGGEGMNCSMTTMLAEGAYQVEVVGFGTGDKGRAQIAYQSLGGDSVAIDEAVSIAIDGSAGTAVGFEVEDEGGYLISTSGQLDTVCTLLNAEGEEVGRDDDSGDGMNCGLAQRLTPGAYTVVVTTFGDQSGSATFIVSPNQIKSFPLSVDAPVSARIDAAGGQVEFDLSITDSGRYALSTSGDTDTVCELRAQDGGLMDQNDDGDDQNCRISHALPVGDYRLIVSGFSGTTGAFTAHLDRL
jgi:hypothetical protein